MRKTVIIRFGQGQNTEALPECATAWGLAEEYLDRQGGAAAIALAKSCTRIWAQIETKSGEVSRCTGVTGVREVWDVPFFHVEDDRAMAHLVRRLATVIEESSRPTHALVFVSEEAEAKWKPFLEGIHGYPARRWFMPIPLGE